jgi:hypothetical protein
MNPPTCPVCGKPLAAEGAYCPWCGATVGRSTQQVAAPPPAAFSPWRSLGRYAPYIPSRAVTGVSEASHRNTDVAALSTMTKAATFGIVDSLGGIMLLIALRLYPNALSVVTSNPTGSTLDLYTDPIYLILALALVGLVLVLFELLYCRIAFRTLSTHDSRFNLPGKFVLLSLIGTGLLGLSIAAFVGLFYQAVSCAGTGNPVPANCFSATGALGILILLAISSILSVVGFIGLMVGVWRLGARFKARGFSIGAILLFFPFINLAGWTLILLSGRASRRRIETGRFTAEAE